MQQFCTIVFLNVFLIKQYFTIKFFNMYFLCMFSLNKLLEQFILVRLQEQKHAGKNKRKPNCKWQKEVVVVCFLQVKTCNKHRKQIDTLCCHIN